MLLQHLPGLMNEHLRLLPSRRSSLPLNLPRLQEDLALGYERPDERSECAYPASTPEKTPPRRRRLRYQRQTDNGGEEVANSVTLLKDTGGETTRFDREVLQSGGCRKAPDPAHGDTEEGANGEEGTEGVHEARAEFEDGDHEQVENQWPFASETV